MAVTERRLNVLNRQRIRRWNSSNADREEEKVEPSNKSEERNYEQTTTTLEAPLSPDPPSSTAELPSETRAQRNSFTVVLNKYTDQLLQYLTFASHRVNSLTGTDYSGIAALRASIAEHESKVKEAQRSLSSAREAYEKALETQARSQKEVVQLLERKHSWSAEDLERYMGLIRSEHVNEQAVVAAKSEIEQGETQLEQARQAVERSERKQYHEEQIWSDTIRRNSTWVTFGLMGVNIALLIANLVFIEPWRRRRMVKEIKGALDEKTAGAFVGSPAVAQSNSGTAVEASTPPANRTLEELKDEALAEIEQQEPEVLRQLTQAAEDTIDGAAQMIADGATTVEESHEPGVYIIDGRPVRRWAPIAAEVDDDGNYIERPDEGRKTSYLERVLSVFSARAWADSWHDLVQGISDSLSEQEIILRRVDLTTRMVEGLGLGIMVTMILILLFPIYEAPWPDA